MSRKTRLELGEHTLLATVGVVICNAPESYNFWGCREHSMMCLHFIWLNTMGELIIVVVLYQSFIYLRQSPVYSWIYHAQ
jgi:hypothetical protein